MFFVEPYAHAPEWLRVLADRFRPEGSAETRAVGFIAHHPDVGPSLRERAALRDREYEVAAMLRGLVADLGAPVRVTAATGRTFRDMGTGFDPVGAQFTITYKLLVA